MINWLFSLKHWQLFLVTTVLPIGVQLVAMVMMFSRLGDDMYYLEENPDIFSSFMWTISGISVLASIPLYVWYWGLGTRLPELLPPDVSLQTKRFRLFFILAIAVALLVIIVIFSIIPMDMTDPEPPDPTMILAAFAILMPLYGLMLFSLVYMLYFIAKSLKSVEMRREAYIGDYIAELMLFWIYPVGVWFLQPRINQIFSGKPEGRAEDHLIG